MEILGGIALLGFLILCFCFAIRFWKEYIHLMVRAPDYTGKMRDPYPDRPDRNDRDPYNDPHEPYS